ncbi:hypothetical protein ACEPAI_5893 [Sanghuangporus weigelae]
MLRVVGLFYLLGIFSLVSASNSCPQQNVMNRHERRQVQATSLLIAPFPTTSTSSFNYWWPFPPATISASVPTVTEVDTDGDDTSEVAETISNGSLLESSTVSSSGVASTSRSPSEATLSQSDWTSTTALITITALPPLTSPLKHSHRISAYSQPVNPVMFAPLLGVLGLGIGLVSGWYIYGYWKRRQDMRRVIRLAGSRYRGINTSDVDDDEKDTAKYDHGEIEDAVYKELLLDQPFLRKDDDYTPGAISLRRPGRYQTESSLSHISVSMLHRSPLLAGFSGGHTELGTEPDIRGADEIQDGKRGQIAANILSPNAPTVSSSIASYDEDDDDYEDARRPANRRGIVDHKSIRRRLAEKLRLQFNPGHSFIRQKSRKQRKTRGTTPELEQGVLLQDSSLLADSPIKSDKGPLRRAKTRPANSVLGHGRAISDFSVFSDSIRTPPRVYTLKDPGVCSPVSRTSQIDQTYSTPLKSANNSGIDDKYTPLPDRRVRSGCKLVSVRSTRRRAEIIDDSDRPPKFNLPEDANRRVLPTSPPLLSSSELESALFFNSSSTASGKFQEVPRPFPHERVGYHSLSRHDPDSPTRGSPSRRAPLGPRQSKKLVSEHSPASGIGIFAMDIQPPKTTMTPAPLRRSTARASSCSPRKRGHGSGCTNLGRERSSTIPSVPMSPRERYEARQTAFHKVDAIVERSWSARLLMGDQALPSSAESGVFTERSTPECDYCGLSRAHAFNFCLESSPPLALYLTRYMSDNEMAPPESPQAADVDTDTELAPISDNEENDTDGPDDYLLPMIADEERKQLEKKFEKYVQGDWGGFLMQARRNVCALQALSANTKLIPADYASDFCEVLCFHFRKGVPSGKLLAKDIGTTEQLVIVSVYGLAKMLEDHDVQSNMETTLSTSWGAIIRWLLIFNENFGVLSGNYSLGLARSMATLLAQASKLGRIKARICSNFDMIKLIVEYWSDADNSGADEEGDASRALANCGNISDAVRKVLIGLILRRSSGVVLAVMMKLSTRIVDAQRFTKSWRALDGYARALKFFRPIPPETSCPIQMSLNVDDDACEVIERMRDNLPAIFPCPGDDDYQFACTAISGLTSFYAYTFEQTYGTALARRLLFSGFLASLFQFSGFLRKNPMMTSFRAVVSKTLVQTLPRYLGQHSLLTTFKDDYFQCCSKEGREKIARSSVVNAWSLFEGFLLERLAYKALFDDNQDQGGNPSYCGNPDCQKLDENNTFQVCSACKTARYCSKECQLISWKHKGHKHDCKNKDPEVEKNLEFILYCIRRDIIRHLPGLRALAKQKLQNIDFNLVGVGIDYTRLPTRFEVFRLQTLLSQISGHEPATATRLTRLLKKAKKGGKDEIFIRAVLPYGSGKTKTEYAEVSLKSVDAFTVSENERHTIDQKIKRPVGVCDRSPLEVVPHDKTDKYMAEKLEPELMGSS